MGGLGAGSASAADLGGNCCADLEERIAELEATTARKGNRKVSLTISGWVGEQVLWWDDGAARGTYVTGLGTTLASHVTFSGQATILPGWYAGYVLQLEMDEADPLGNLSQNVNIGPVGFVAGTGLPNVFYSYWFVKSDHLGKVSVGLQSSAGDNAAILVDGSGSLVPANWVQFDNAAFFIRSKNGALSDQTWSSVGFCNIGHGNAGDCVGTPENLVRYDSPVFAGFSVSADWGQDTYWDVYARYAGEWNGIKVAAVSGWSETNGCQGNQFAGPLSSGFIGTTCINSPGIFNPTNISGDVGYWQSGLYIEHVATGLWVLGNYGREFLSDMPGGVNAFGTDLGVLNSEPEHWYVKAGLRERWTSLGHTVMYGFYGKRDDMIGGVNVAADNVTGATTRQYGLGVVQEVDAAAMSFWLQWDHEKADIACGNVVAAGPLATTSNGCAINQNVVIPVGGSPTATNLGSGFDAINIIKGGALINF